MPARNENRPPPAAFRPPAAAADVSTDDAARWQNLLLQAAIIILAGLWIYSPTYHGEWLWDDDQLVWQNAVVQSTSLRGLAKLWFNPDGADFFPLSYTALWAQWPFFHDQPTGYHITTIVLHIVASLLLWALLDRMRIPGAWLSGLLFAIHPVAVESVAWVSETKNTLSLPFFLLSCLCWVMQDEDQNEDQNEYRAEHHDDEKDGGGRRTALYLASIVFFLLAMLAKTSMVAMPVVLLLHAWWKRGEVTIVDLIRSAPFFMISLALGIITCRYQWSRAIGAETIIVGGVASRIATAGMAILFYLKQIVWPINLLPIYPKWAVDPPKPEQFLAWPVIFAATAWCWMNRGTWGRHALFALGFFLLMVAPVLGFVTIAYMRITWVADHFIYLPMIGPVALMGAAVMWLYERVERRSRLAFVAGGSIVLATFCLLSFLYANAWANEDKLWTYTLQLNDDAWQAHNRLGARLFSRGDVQKAFQHFAKATRLRPDLGETHNNLGTALSALGRHNEAIAEYLEANRCTPNVDAMQLNLANALFAAKRFKEAAEPFRALLSRSPDNPALHNNLGVTLYRAGETEEAIREFRRALELKPDLKDAIEGLAVATGEKPDPLAGQLTPESAPQAGIQAGPQSVPQQPLFPQPPLQPQQQPGFPLQQPAGAQGRPAAGGFPGQSTLGPPTFPAPRAFESSPAPGR